MTTFAERYAEIDARIAEFNEDVRIVTDRAIGMCKALAEKRLEVIKEGRRLGLKKREINLRLAKITFRYLGPAGIPALPAEPPLDIPALDIPAIEAAEAARAAVPMVTHDDGLAMATQAMGVSHHAPTCALLDLTKNSVVCTCGAGKE